MRKISLLGLLLVCSAQALFGQSPDFPLRVSGDQRYLVDAADRPFFYQADTPWWLFYRLTYREVEEYLDARKAQGFTALQIMLTGGKDLKNLYGQGPFLSDNDLSQPNEAYFARTDSLIALASAKGFYLAMVPLWSGCCRQDYAGETPEGNPAPLNANGPRKAYDYGVWLGKRYGKLPNVMWILGGDNDPFNARSEINALATGLRSKSKDQLFTYHAASTHSSTDVWPPETPWLDVSMVYTYFRGFEKAWNRIQPDVYEVCRTEWRKNQLPFFLGESTYESEHLPLGSALQVRKQAYWAAFSGATGHAYGSPNWKLDPKDDWREVLQYPGAVSLVHLPKLMHQFGWPNLHFDFSDQLLTAGKGAYASNDFAVGIFTEDYLTALVYVPSQRSIRIRAGVLRGVKHSLSWFNPRTGNFSPPQPLDFQRQYTPPRSGDWVAVLRGTLE